MSTKRKTDEPQNTPRIAVVDMNLGGDDVLSIPVELKTETHRLMCQLTDDEQRTRGIELAAATALLNDLTEQKKSIAGKIADTTATISQLAETVKHKQEERPVVCVMDPDYKADTMTIRRTDNGLVVAVRQLTHAERQPDLPMAGEGGVQCK
jgi:hypothetical protein